MPLLSRVNQLPHRWMGAPRGLTSWLMKTQGYGAAEPRARKKRPATADRSVAPLGPEEMEEEMENSPPGRSALTVQR